MTPLSARKPPSEKAIREYWRDKLWRVKGFDSPEEFMEPGVCFACGSYEGAVLERAHIKAKGEGGTDSPDNLHVLCHVCHQDSEGLSGERYFQWLKQRSFMDMITSASCRAGMNLWHETRQGGKNHEDKAE